MKKLFNNPWLKSKTLAGSLTVALISMLFGSMPAFAGIGISVAPNFPGSVKGGQTGVAASMNITNGSSGGTTTITLDNIYLTPSCGDFSVPCTTADPGVFAVSGTATGAQACLGTSFTVAVVDAATGKVQFTPSSTINLALGATCEINFTVNVLKVPTHDAVAGGSVQTVQGGQVTAHAGDLPGSGTGTNVTTVDKANSNVVTHIRNQANADITGSTTPIGTVIHDEATVSGSGSTTPTGTVDFTIFNNPNCSGTSGNIQSGVALVAGTANSATTSAPSGGISYLVHYNGDANFNSSDGVCESLNTTQLTPTVTTHIHNSSHSDITGTTVVP